MLAVTISQPYASLIASGEKWVENRTWRTDYRGPLAIHAGKGTQYLTTHELRRYPTGAIIAVGTLRTCLLLDHARERFEAALMPYDAQKAGMSFADVERFLSHEHTEGPWCWVLDGVRRIEPVKIAGKQGLWECLTG